MAVSEKLRDFLAEAEGLGGKTDKGFVVYNDPAGLPTIGRGHLVKKGEKYERPLTLKEVDALFERDVEDHIERARGEIDKEFGAGTFNSLGQNQRDMLAAYTYQVGSLKNAPNFREAVVRGRPFDATREALTFYRRGSDKKLVADTGRLRKFAAAFLPNGHVSTAAAAGSLEDSHAADYTSELEKQLQADKEELRALGIVTGELGSPASEPTSPTSSPSEPSTPTPEQGAEEEGGGVFSNVLRGLVAGVREGSTQPLDALNELPAWAHLLQGPSGVAQFAAQTTREAVAGDTPELNIAEKAREALPVEPDKDSITGQLTKGFTQFGVSFLPFLRYAKGAQIGSTILTQSPRAVAAIEGAVAGAGADFFAFDPQEARLSNLLRDLGAGHEGVRGLLDNPVTRALAAEEDDDALIGRLKNVAEGGALGLAAETIIPLVRGPVRALRARRALRREIDGELVGKTAAEQIDGLLARAQTLRETLGDLRLATEEEDAVSALAPEIEELTAATRAQLRGQVADVEEQLASAEADLIVRLSRNDVGQDTVKKVRTYLTEHAPENLKREAADIDAQAAAHTATNPASIPVEKPDITLANRLQVTQTQARSVADAISSGNFEAAADHLVQVYDNTNYERLAEPDGIKDLLRGFAEVFGQNPKSLRLQDTRPLLRTEERAAAMLKQNAIDFNVPEEQVAAAVNELIPGVQNLDVKLNAIRMLELSLAKKINEVAERVARAGGDARLSENADFLRWVTLAANVNDLRAGIAGEVGRALSSMRISATGFADALSEQAAQALVGRAGGSQKVARLANMFAQSPNSRTTQKLLQRAQAGRLQLAGDMFMEHFFASLLSGPITLAVNAIGNTVTALTWLPAEAAVRDVYRAVKHQDMEALRGLTKMVFGMAHGARVALLGNAAGRRVAARSAYLTVTGRAGQARRNLLDAMSTNNVQVPTAIQAFGTGSTVSGGRASFDLERQLSIQGPGAITSANMGKVLGDRLGTHFRTRGSWGGRLVDAYGTANRWQFRSMTAFDELAKAVNYHARIARLAFEDGFDAGLRGQQLDAHMESLIRDIPDATGVARLTSDPDRLEALRAMDVEARRYASEATFTEDLAAGSLSKSLQNLARNHPSVRVLLPFIQTPTNLLRFSLVDRGPLAPLSKRIRREWAAGGRVREEMVARLTVASTFWTAAGMMALNGFITGSGPVNPDVRKTKIDAGWQPYSVAVPVGTNDDGSTNYRYFSYQRGDPFAVMFGIAADVMEVIGEGDRTTADELAGKAVVALVENLKSKAYFRGLQDFMLTLHDPDRWIGSFVGRTTSTALVPQSNLLATLRRTQDRAIAQTDRTSLVREVTDMVRSRLPKGNRDPLQWIAEEVFSYKLNDIEPKLNLFGEVIAYPPGFGPDMVSPVFQSRTSPDFVKRELERIGYGINMSRSFGSITAGGQTIKLTPTQTNRLIRLAAQPPGGMSLHDRLERLMKSDGWKLLGDPVGEIGGGKMQKVNDIIRTHKDRALRRLLADDQGLRAAVRQAKINARRARTAEGSEQVREETSQGSAAASLRDALGLQ